MQGPWVNGHSWGVRWHRRFSLSYLRWLRKGGSPGRFYLDINMYENIIHLLYGYIMRNFRDESSLIDCPNFRFPTRERLH